MARFDYDGETVSLYLTDDDIGLLDSLTEQLTELLSADQPEPPATSDDEDPFALWEADLAESPDEPEPLEDPALQRLFPNPYPHDPQAASEHRRYSEGELRRRKLGDLEVLREALRQRPVLIPAAQVPAWLKSLNALRLVLASRLGVDDEESMEELQHLPDDDPRSVLAAVMDWLAYLQGVLIELTDDQD
ncbi:uncharacterized protein DUF2017 [Propionibacteriaceae bacterium ES.041]|uniref:DUF2017 domain-containing protein n=1 Tax=Enemella evansiae TaxID=2016499 RepID=UPI000C01E82D|nr:DUF2017 domain-containing protein [Enemella evansiae]PFG66350.1 uncharacterized protein DUF2017 [Propionibacteriaceae bacterium ES.041]TDO88057.1 uncharacterized protein DUF2017 [Enemella evansiae]